ncbi:MAG: hypothetical protein ABEI53_03380, partial [Candidatus Magasanikbacteria bacterium]
DDSGSEQSGNKSEKPEKAELDDETLEGVPESVKEGKVRNQLENETEEKPEENHHVVDSFRSNKEFLLDKFEQFEFGKLKDIEVNPESLISDTHLSARRLTDPSYGIERAFREGVKIRTNQKYIDKIKDLSDFREVVKPMKSIDEISEVITEESLKRVVSFQVSQRKSQMQTIEGELRSLFEFIRNPTEETLKGVREGISCTHDNALPIGYGFASMKSRRDHLIENVKNNQALFHSYISEDVIEGILTYYFYRSDGPSSVVEKLINPSATHPEFDWMDEQIVKGVAPPFIEAYKKILEGHRQYFQEHASSD